MEESPQPLPLVCVAVAKVVRASALQEAERRFPLVQDDVVAVGQDAQPVFPPRSPTAFPHEAARVDASAKAVGEATPCSALVDAASQARASGVVEHMGGDPLHGTITCDAPAPATTPCGRWRRRPAGVVAGGAGGTTAAASGGSLYCTGEHCRSLLRRCFRDVGRQETKHGSGGGVSEHGGVSGQATASGGGVVVTTAGCSIVRIAHRP